MQRPRPRPDTQVTPQAPPQAGRWCRARSARGGFAPDPRPAVPSAHRALSRHLTRHCLRRAGLRTRMKWPSRFPRPPAPAPRAPWIHPDLRRLCMTTHAGCPSVPAFAGASRPGRPASGQSAVPPHRRAAGVRSPVHNRPPGEWPNGRPWPPMTLIVMTPVIPSSDRRRILAPGRSPWTDHACAATVGGGCAPRGSSRAGLDGRSRPRGRSEPFRSGLDPAQKDQVRVRNRLSGHRDVPASTVPEIIRRIRRRFPHPARALQGWESRGAPPHGCRAGHTTSKWIRRSVMASGDGPRRLGRLALRMWGAWWA